MSFISGASVAKNSSNTTQEFLTFMLDGQLLGIPVLQIQDVLTRQKVTRVPLALPEIEGSLNLRGRIVTAINLRKRLCIEGETPAKTMSIVVEHRNDLYSLTVDSVGDVVGLCRSTSNAPPVTLEPVWRQHASEIYRLDDTLLVILDIGGMLNELRVENTERVA